MRLRRLPAVLTFDLLEANQPTTLTDEPCSPLERRESVRPRAFLATATPYGCEAAEPLTTFATGNVLGPLQTQSCAREPEFSQGDRGGMRRASVACAGAVRLRTSRTTKNLADVPISRPPCEFSQGNWVRASGPRQALNVAVVSGQLRAAHQEDVRCPRGLAALGDGPDDERLAALAVAC